MKFFSIRSHVCILYVLTALSFFPLSAQNSGSGQEAAQKFDLTFQHTTVVVSDFIKSKKFYTEVLQLKELNADWLPENQMFLSLGENLELHVGEVDGVEIDPSSVNHFALSVADFDNFLRYLKAQGVVYSNLGGGQDYYVQNRPDGVRQTYFQDPDGYWIEVNDME